MASTYVNNLRLNEMATGDGSGTWGTTTNTNLELIGQALGYGTRAIANASTDNITIADGASDSDRAMYLKLTGGGQACTVTLLPNTASKVWMMENATSYTLTFTQGSGANVAILAGETKFIATDGGGSGGVVYDVLTDLSVNGFSNDGDYKSVTAGTSNLVLGVNAGNSIASGGNYNVTVGDEAGTAITTGDHNVALGYSALVTEDAHGYNTAIGGRSLFTLNAGAEGYNTAVGYDSGRLRFIKS